MTSKRSAQDNRVDRSARLMWCLLSGMKVSPIAQREKLDMARVERIAREFDPDKFDAPKINRRGGTDWIIDGWHRTEGARLALGDDQSVQCWVRQDLSDAEAAEWSLGLNDYRAWNAMDKFRLALTAGRPLECDIDRIVKSLGLVVSRDELPGAVRAVGTLIRVYSRSGPAVLARTLKIIRDAYGDAGLDAPVIDGIGHLCARYNGDLDDDLAVERLGRAAGGVNGLLNKATVLRKQTGNAKSLCVAAAAVEIVNATRGGKKLPSWWKAA